MYVLREIHGLRIDETEEELGLTAQQVEQALFAARNRLAELLVFGERLSCVSVPRLVSGPLELDERRALKTHLRSCSACRAAVGRRARALTLAPVSPFARLRALANLGGAPAAVKVGAAVATATLAAGASAPLVVHEKRHDPSPFAHVTPGDAQPAARPRGSRSRPIRRSPRSLRLRRQRRTRSSRNGRRPSRGKSGTSRRRSRQPKSSSASTPGRRATTSRAYAGPGDLRRMQRLVQDAWALVGPKNERHVGDVAWGATQHVGREPEWRRQLWKEHGRLVAYGWLHRPRTLDWQLDPRRPELLHNVLDWFEAEAEEEPFETSALADDAAGIEILRARGYEEVTGVRWFAFLLRDLRHVPEPELPEGYTLRTV